MERSSYSPTAGMQSPADRTGADEISLLDLCRIVWHYKWLIAAVTGVSTIAAIVYALLATPIYRVEVLLQPVIGEAYEGGLSSVGGQLGGLASLAGISLGTGENSKDSALAILKSRAFTVEFLRQENLLPVLYADKWDPKNKKWIVEKPEQIPNYWKAYQLFNERVRFVSENAKTGLITLAIEWPDRKLAARWANLLVDRVNEHIRRQDIEDARKSIEYLKKQMQQANVVGLQEAITKVMETQIRKIMLANVRDQYAFKILDPGVVPPEGEVVKPRRALIAVLGLIGGGILGLAIAFVVNLGRQNRERSIAA